MRILDLVNLDYGKAVMGNFRFYSDTEIFEFDVGTSLVELKENWTLAEVFALLGIILV